MGQCMYTWCSGEGFLFLAWNESSCLGTLNHGNLLEPIASFQNCMATDGKTRQSFHENTLFEVILLVQQQWSHTSTMKMIWKSPFVAFLSFHSRAEPPHQMLILVHQCTVMFAMSHWWQRQNLHMGVLFLRLVSSLFQQSLLFHLAGRSFTSFPESCCPSQVWLGWEWSQTGSKYVCVCVCLCVVLSMCVCVCTVY